eukprot:662898-Prymnesium_polylepis.1
MTSMPPLPLDSRSTTWKSWPRPPKRSVTVTRQRLSSTPPSRLVESSMSVCQSSLSELPWACPPPRDTRTPSQAQVTHVKKSRSGERIRAQRQVQGYAQGPVHAQRVRAWHLRGRRGCGAHVKLGETLHLVGRDLVVRAQRGVQLAQLVRRRRDHQHGHLAEVLARDGDDALALALGRLLDLDAVVEHDLARVAHARVEEARHVKLDGRVGLGEVLELLLAADRAGEAEDARVLVEDVRRADARVARLGERVLSDELVRHVLQPRRRERHLRHLAVVVEHDHLLLAVLVLDQPVVDALLDVVLAVAHDRARADPEHVIDALGRVLLDLDAPAVLELLVALLEVGRLLDVRLD